LSQGRAWIIQLFPISLQVRQQKSALPTHGLPEEVTPPRPSHEEESIIGKTTKKRWPQCRARRANVDHANHHNSEKTFREEDQRWNGRT
jgi:hypothetical protein